MKAIQTIYKGYKFRSRLEARWAVFFDAMNIDWQYEVEGYVFEDGVCYLPDFWLPTFNGGMYVEVKPIKFTEEEKNKCIRLCEESRKDVWLAIGIPSCKGYVYLSCWKDSDGEDVIEWSVGIPNHDDAKFKDRMLKDPDYDSMIYTDEYPIPYQYLIYGDIAEAVLEAKQARFEHKNK
jgi:hypothetical protein